MIPTKHITYLHGLGSGPRSKKGVLVQEYFTARGYTVSLPSISVPSLESLSPLQAIELVRQEIVSRRGQALVLMGSSFGAFVAVHALSRLSRAEQCHVQRVVLLAPVFDPFDPRSGLLTPEREQEWRKRGSAPVLNLETDKEVQVSYKFVEELRTIDSRTIKLPMPVFIMHGIEDEVVPVSQSELFASTRSGVTLELVHDTHQLLGDPQKMLESIQHFLLSGSTDSR